MTGPSESHTTSYTALATGALSRIVAPAYQPAVYLARQACLSLLSRLNQSEACGVLEIIEQGGQQRILYGDPVSKRAVQRRTATETDMEGATIKTKGSVSTHAVLHIKNDIFWVRLALGNDLGFAEAYMLAEVDTPDLAGCFKLFIENRTVLSNLSVGLISKASSYLQSVLNRRYANTKRGSLRNIGAHYDISNRMYEAFLSHDMSYSCAVFPTLDADIAAPLLQSVQSFRTGDAAMENISAIEHSINSRASTHGTLTASKCGVAPRVRYEASAVPTASATAEGGTSSAPDGQLTPPESIAGGAHSPVLLGRDELEDGQMRKIRLHLDRAALQPHHRLLEIGTGWGALAIEAVRSSGCMMDSLTLSVEQKALAEQRIREAGLQDKITVHLMDYRDMPVQWTDRFDRIISVEMLEAVGIEFLSTYFQHVNRVLKRDGGVCVVQVITMPEERFDDYKGTVDFIRKWIFPGGVLPSVTCLLEAVAKGSKGSLVLDTVHSIGPHYARTLREWRHRFERHFDKRIAPALLDDHVEIRSLPLQEKKRQVEVFRRKWLYYFIYCEVGFTERVIGDHILSFTRSGNKTLPVCCI